MKKLITIETILFLLIISISVAEQKVDANKFVGRYQRPLSEFREVENEIFEVKLSSKGLSGIYDGIENDGEHGNFYFRSIIEHIDVDPKGTVRFSLPYRELYEKPVMKGRKSEIVGSAKPDAVYEGQLLGEDLVFECHSKSYDCPQSTMTFRRVK